jgi:hypothetical protein
MADEEVLVVSTTEGMTTRGRTRTISKKNEQVGANAAARLLEICQKLVQCHQDHLSFDSVTIKQYLGTLETKLVERINASVTNKVSIAVENAHVGTEERLAATVEKTIQNVKLLSGSPYVPVKRPTLYGNRNVSQVVQLFRQIQVDKFASWVSY